MKIKDVLMFLEEIAPLHLQESYDNAGLICGDSNNEVTGITVCLDALESIVDEAVSNGSNLIIAHHPIIFKGLKRINGNNYIERTIIKAIKNDIAIYAIHTNLDNVYLHGVNTKFAQKIGLTDVKVLAPKSIFDSTSHQNGAGAIGRLDVPMKTLDFLEHIKNSMKISTFKHTALCKEFISKVALCGGSGSFLLDTAISLDADVYISSDFKYHEYFDANDKIIILDIGHYESEKFTIDLLYDLLINNFTTFATHYTKNNTNPIKYY